MNKTLRTLNFIGIKIWKYLLNINQKPLVKFYGYFSPHPSTQI